MKKPKRKAMTLRLTIENLKKIKRHAKEIGLSVNFIINSLIRNHLVLILFASLAFTACGSPQTGVESGTSITNQDPCFGLAGDYKSDPFYFGIGVNRIQLCQINSNRCADSSLIIRSKNADGSFQVSAGSYSTTYPECPASDTTSTCVITKAAGQLTVDCGNGSFTYDEGKLGS